MGEHISIDVTISSNTLQDAAYPLMYIAVYLLVTDISRELGIALMIDRGEYAEMRAKESADQMDGKKERKGIHSETVTHDQGRRRAASAKF